LFEVNIFTKENPVKDDEYITLKSIIVCIFFFTIENGKYAVKFVEVSLNIVSPYSIDLRF